MKLLVALLLAAPAFAASSQESPLTRPPPSRERVAAGFIQNDPGIALSLARTGNTLLLIDFYSTASAPCLRLHEAALGKKPFLDAARGMTKIAVDADSSAGWEWRQRYGIVEYPTLVLTDTKLREIGRLTGFRLLGGLLRWIGDQQALAEEPIALATERLGQSTPALERQRRKRLGLWHFDRREYVQAIQMLDGLGDKEARKMELLARRKLSLRDGDAKSAELALRLLLEEYPDDPDNATWLAEMFAPDREFALARLDLTRRMLAAWRGSNALELTRWEPGDLYELEAALLEKAGRAEEAKRVYLQGAGVFEIAAKDASIKGAPGATLRRAQLLQRAGRFEEADAIFETRIATSSGSAAALLAYAQSLHQRKEDAKALPWTQTAEGAAYGDLWLHVVGLEVAVMRALGRAEEAQALFNRATAAVHTVGPQLRGEHSPEATVERLRESLAPADITK